MESRGRGRDSGRLPTTHRSNRIPRSHVTGEADAATGTSGGGFLKKVSSFFSSSSTNEAAAAKKKDKKKDKKKKAAEAEAEAVDGIEYRRLDSNVLLLSLANLEEVRARGGFDCALASGARVWPGELTQVLLTWFPLWFF